MPPDGRPQSRVRASPALDASSSRRARRAEQTSPSRDACTTARAGRHARLATTPRTCTRAPATTSTKSSARSSACSRRARACHHAARLVDARLSEASRRARSDRGRLAARPRAGAGTRAAAAAWAHVAARVELAHHGLTNQAGRRCDSGDHGAAGSAGSRRRPRTSVTRQVDRHAPPSAARRSSQARSHRRHSSADRRQCSW